MLRDPIMRPTLLAVATVNLFNFASSALFILYATTTLGVSPGRARPGARRRARSAAVHRGGHRVADRPADRARTGLRARLLIFPVSLILIPIAEPDMPMAVILGLLLVSEFGAGLGVMILDINIGAINYARTPDRIRARADGAFRFINYGVRPIGALFGGLLGAAIGVREALFVVTIAAQSRGPVAVGSPVLRLRDLPDARGLAAGLAPTYSQRKVRDRQPDGRRRPRRRGWRAAAQRRRRADPSATRKRVGERRRRQQPGERGQRSGQVRPGSTIPPSSRNAMNRPLARASVASARSAPASSRPSPANASVPSSSAHDEQRRARRPAPAASRGPRPRSRRAARPAPTSTARTATHLGRRAGPPRVSGEPPSRLRTP